MEENMLIDSLFHEYKIIENEVSKKISKAIDQNYQQNNLELKPRTFSSINFDKQNEEITSCEHSNKVNDTSSSREIVFKTETKPTSMSNESQWNLKRVIVGHQGWVRCSSIDPSNEFFATGSNDRTIKFWDLATGQLKLTYTGHISVVRTIEISKQSPYLFSGSEDKTVKCWDLNTNKQIRNFHGHLSGVYNLSLHPKLNLIASAGRDCVVRLWDIRSRQQVHVFEGHSDVINCVRMMEDEPQLISGSADSTIRFWDIAAGKCVQTLTNHKKGIRSLANHPIEYSFASSAADNCKLWKCPEGSFLRNIEKFGDYELFNSICVSETDVLIGGSDTGNLVIWDWSSGRIVQTIANIPQPGSLEGEKGIFDVKFDYSATRIISCECDKTIKIYSIEHPDN